MPSARGPYAPGSRTKRSGRRGAFLLARLQHVLWLRASLYAAAAVSAAMAAHLLGPLAPPSLVEFVGEDPAEELLKVMASSMLAVATFSLTAMVAAAGSITSNASPRAAALLLEDKSAQSALASFIAAFIFSIVGLVAMGTGLYDGPARFVLFLETLGVLGFVVVRLLAWIDQVSHMVRVGSAIDHVERALIEALARREPFLGARPADATPPGEELMPDKVGYVQHIDVARLDQLAAKHGFVAHLQVLPGSFLLRSRPMLRVDGCAGRLDERVADDLRRCVVVGDQRTFEQDPRFGLVVLSEIASRALSPAINDPGSAIDVVRTATRVLSVWGEEHWEEAPRGQHRHVTAPGLSAADCFDDIFSPIERDGAAFLEVGVALQKAFADLARSSATGFAAAARRHSGRALRLAEAEIRLPEDLEALRRLAPAGAGASS